MFLENGNANYTLSAAASGHTARGKGGGVWVARFSDGARYKGLAQEDAALGLDTTGLVMGVDFYQGDRSVIGASFSDTSADMSYEDGLKDGTLDSYLWSTYASHFFSDHLYGSSVVTFGRTDSESLRAILLGDDVRKAHSLHSGDILSAVVETGRVFETGSWSTEPYTTLEYLSVREDGFTEEGAGGISLVVDPDRSEYLTSVTGFRLGRYFQNTTGEKLLMLQMNAGWLHHFDLGSNTIRARFEEAPQGAFTIDRERNLEEGLRLGGAATFMGEADLDISARVTADLYPDETDVSGLMQLNMKF
jgi:subtilase-type serine protease